MTPAERLETIKRYAERLSRLGPAVQALGWRDGAQQELRFDVMTGEMRGFEGARVLDIGCGFGDLYDYLASRGVRVDYTGCDISPDVLAVARSRHRQLTFEQRDIVERPYPDGAFDYVFMSGLFNHRIGDNRGFMEKTVAAAYRACRVSAVANMMKDEVDYREDHLYYFNPESVGAFCRTLSPDVSVRKDYPLYEFTVFVRRQPESSNA